MWEPTIPGMRFNRCKLEESAPMSALGHKQKFGPKKAMSALPRKRTSIIVNGMLALFHSVRSTISFAIRKAWMNGHLGSTTIRLKKFNLPAGGLRSTAQKVYILHKKLSPHGALSAKPAARGGGSGANCLSRSNS
jgi:hypothetical protein